MPVDVTTHIVIAQPRLKVAEYAWYVNIKSVEWKTRRAVAVGSQIAFVAHFPGRRMAYTCEIAEFVPGERLVMRTTDRPFPMKTTYTWASIDGGTRLTQRNCGAPARFLESGSALYETRHAAGTIRKTWSP